MGGPPAGLTAPELLALFPFAVPLPPGDASVGDSGAPELDEAAALRAAEPISEAALRAALAGKPAAQLVAAAQIALARLHRWYAFLAVPMLLACSVTIAPVFAFNGAGVLFPQRSLVAQAVIRAALFSLAMVSAIITQVGSRGLAAQYRSPDRRKASDDLSAHPYAGVVRWAQLVGAGGSKLVEHAPGAFCPCPDCAGNLPEKAAAAVLGFYVCYLPVDMFVWFTAAWTAAVTFAGPTWSTPWSAFVTGTYIAVQVFYSLAVHLPNQINSHPPMALLHRLRHRAVLLLLRDLVARLQSQPPDAEQPTHLSSEPYVSLHRALSASWASHLAAASMGRWFHIFAGTFCALCAVVSALVSGCVPVFYLLCLVIGIYTVRDLALVAVWNAGISSVRALYASAATELLGIGTPPAARHAELLRTLAAQDARGRWLGVGVDYGVVRTVAATAFTVLVGLVTLAKGAGVAFVLDCACGRVPVGPS